MLMADGGGSDLWSLDDHLSAGDDDEGGGDLSIDIDSLWEILDENPDPSPLQSSPEDLSGGRVLQGLPKLERASSFGAELPVSVTLSPSHNSEASDYRAGTADGFLVSAGNSVIFDHEKQEPLALTGSSDSCSGNLADWMLPVSCQDSSSAGNNGGIQNVSSYGRDFREEPQNEIPNCGATFSFVAGDATDISDFREVLDSNQLKSGTEFQFGHLEGETYSQYESPHQLLNFNYEKTSGTLETLGTSMMGIDTLLPWDLDRLNFHFMPNNNEMVTCIKDEFEELPTQTACVRDEMVCGKDERNDEPVLAWGMTYDVLDDTCSRKSPAGFDGFPTDKGLRQWLAPTLPTYSSEKLLVHPKGEKEDLYIASKRARHHLDNIGEAVHRNLNPVADDHFLHAKASEQPHLQSSPSLKMQIGYTNDEIGNELIQTRSMDAHLSKISCHTIQSNAMHNSYHADDDSDICIIEDISGQSRSHPCSMNRKALVTSQSSTFSDPLGHMGMGGVRPKANDERHIFRVVLQDLSQPTTEASLPDGVLAVPLLRHQRIALSWMVQKETASLNCSGGILADDQGLGKTVSTIALILKERAPPYRVFPDNLKHNEMETLNLDDDDDCVLDPNMLKQDVESCLVQAKGRPAAGTLVVCPTSVLRQWADELHNKVTSSAKLSVLVYHGSNRTKDPCELAKYDVVLTTYSIVSMEVPKQPLVDKEDEETGRQEVHFVPPMGLSSSKKRKYPPTSRKRSVKDKEGVDNAMFESTARPLARVGWFRVVLDEAQSIKNHRTQVARACWGLRAKRRWCLSGTPIQNAVDDLYSYFRFLRYDPYAVYKSFCSAIKVPINRNPTNGYKKLQAVLKAIMLRRTKGTLLDGEPIINLPPKSVELKKVDFTVEERGFYCRLEADSRAQFAEYAAAGTVKQNYVNILLMLLRLRQACDHPLLIRGYDSSSAWRSSVETAKKLPREKKVCLLNCLEASLAICGICNDPPEDAVVTSCEHVFCNQCVSEHLTVDDNQCPATNCKARLSMSSVFSRETLKCSLSEQPGQDGNPDCSVSEAPDKVEPGSWSRSFDSSKIKAALEVLQSLSKPSNCTPQIRSSESIDDGATCPENLSGPLLSGLEQDVLDNRNSDIVKGSNGLIKVAGEKAIVFSQWTRMLDLLENGLINSSIQYRRLDGTMSILARDKAVKEFNTLPEVSVMIMSLKAASLGLNMVAACHVIILDLWWNPTTEDQAVDRAHRIGQTRPVSVLRLTVKDTVEDRILALQQKKREMVASAFGEDESGSRQTRLTVEDLKYLFQV